MIIKVTLTIIFLIVMVGVGLYSRKQASSVDGFVLGGRSVGPWLTAFASLLSDRSVSRALTRTGSQVVRLRLPVWP